MSGIPVAAQPDATEVSVIVPAFNERDNVQLLVDEIGHALTGLAFEMVFVDDCSTDDTVDQLRAAARRWPQLRVLRHQRRCGQSMAVRSGAKAARGAWIATLDGDGQNDPADLCKLLSARANAPPDVGLFAGWRTQRHDTWLRRLSSRIANSVRSALLQDHTPDSGCGLKVLQRALFLDLPYFDHMHRFLPALVLRAGYRTVSVPVRHRPRLRGVSKYGVWNRLWVGIADLRGVAWLRRRARLTCVEEMGRGGN